MTTNKFEQLLYNFISIAQASGVNDFEQLLNPFIDIAQRSRQHKNFLQAITKAIKAMQDKSFDNYSNVRDSLNKYGFNIYMGYSKDAIHLNLIHNSDESLIITVDKLAELQH